MSNAASGKARWTKGKIVAALRDRQARGLSMTHNAMRPRGPLALAIKRCFGSFNAALHAAGISPRAVKRLRWDRDRILTILRDRHAKGLPVNVGAMHAPISSLPRAIKTYFESYEAALQAAGIDPQKVCRKHWDKATIVTALLDRQARGFAMHRSAVRKSNMPLFGATIRHFVSHDAALRAAGIDPQTVRRGGKWWDKDRIVTALRDRQARGLAMNSSAVRTSAPPLHASAKKHFDSFDASLRAVGVDPQTVRRWGKRWDMSKIVAALRDRRARGLAMNNAAVQASDLALYAAVKKRFVSYDAALRAVGIDPQTVRRWGKRWDRTKIVAALRERQARGHAMNSSAVQASNRSLFIAIIRHFHSHDAALRAIGIDPQTVRRHRANWDKGMIVAALRDRQAKGIPLERKAIVDSAASLLAPIRKHFGSYDAALQAAGIDPRTIHRGNTIWDKETIIAALRDRHAKGLPVNVAAMEASVSSLPSASKKYFESYDAALRAAGIDPQTVRRHRAKWDKDMIVAALRDRQAKGQPVDCGAIRHWISSLGQAIRKYFGSHDSALRAAGIDPWVVRVSRSPYGIPTDPDVVAGFLKERHARGEAMGYASIHRTDPWLLTAIYHHWNSPNEALQAAGIDPQTVRLLDKRWDKAKVVAALRDRQARGAAMNSGAVYGSNRPLHAAAKRCFGSFDAALRVIGIDPSAVGGREYRRGAGAISHWTDDTVLQNLRDLHEEGYDLRHRHMKEHKQPLFYAAKKLFGSYVNAVREAGINYWTMSQAQLAKTRAAAATETDE